MKETKTFLNRKTARFDNENKARQTVLLLEDVLRIDCGGLESSVFATLLKEN